MSTRKVGGTWFLGASWVLIAVVSRNNNTAKRRLPDGGGGEGVLDRKYVLDLMHGRSRGVPQTGVRGTMAENKGAHSAPYHSS